jgi:chromosome segregation ATPase
VTIGLLENERTLLNEKVTRLERELESARAEQVNFAETEEALRQTLERLRQEAQEVEVSREEAVAKLCHASSVVEAQKESISLLEQRALEAERTSGLLSSQVSHLQEALQKHDSSSASHGGMKDSRIRDLEQAVLSLEKQRDEAEAVMRAQREEANRVRRNLIETEKLNASIQARLESSKDSRDKAKLEAEGVCAALEASKASMRRLKDEVEDKRMETDRLKANEKLLNATVSRLNADLMLYKEAALQAEFRLARTNANDGEVGRLKDEIRRKTTKLENLSEVFHSQQQVLSLSQNLEEQLISFIEDVIRQVDEAFDWAPTSKSRGDAVWMRVEGRMELRCLDLAGLEKVCKPSSASRNALWHVIQDVLGKLESKRRQLFDWKQQRSQRVLSVMKTPDGKCRDSSIPDTPTVTETLNNVKRVLSEHLSPLKQKAVSRLDVEYFQKVIHALEHQIDILLEDLQSAKDALATKQQLFVDLEQIASHQEWEKSRLERHLKQREAEIDELQRQVAMNRASAEHELANARAQIHESQQQLQLSRSGVGDSMCSFDGGEPHGTRDADAENDQQRHVSMQMARHLGESRLKLVKLKQLRLRRNTEPLKRIVEGNESS